MIRNAQRLFAIALLVSTTAAFAADPNTPAPTAAKRYGTWGIDLEGMDRSVKPGDDFFKYVNGKWAASAQIPGDKTSWGAFQMLGDLSETRVRAILDDVAAGKNLKGDEAKIATWYRSFLDEEAIEKLDAKPIEKHLAAIRKAESHEDIARLMGRSAGTFGSSFVGAFVSDDAKRPDRYSVYLSQSGLGLADRDMYLKDSFKLQKEGYQKYVAEMLRLAGWENPEMSATDIVALETKIAEAHWTRVESRDLDKTYNLMSIDEIEKAAPGFPWKVAFKEAGLDKIDKLIVRQNTALPKLAKVFAGAPLSTLQAWSAFHVVDDASPYLSKRFADTQWEFRSKFLNGTPDQRPRWKRAVSSTQGSLGERSDARSSRATSRPSRKRRWSSSSPTYASR